MRSLILALLASTALAVPPAAADELDVVATFTILGDMVEEVGGDRVAVTSLVGADGDAHVFQPTPQDARAVAAADVMFVNGLGFEGWIERLIEASGYTGPVVVATRHVPALRYGDDEDHDHAGEAHGHDHSHEEAHAHGHDHSHEEEHAHGHDHAHEEEHAHGHDHDHEEEHAHGHDHAHEEEHDHGHDHAHDHGHGHAQAHGEYDPHAWMSLTAAKDYVRAIAEGLSEADPEGAELYAANAAAYTAELAAVDEKLRANLAALPEGQRTVVVPHAAFRYFEKDYGVRFLSPQGVSTEAEASARDVARLIEQIRAEGINAVFLENITDNRLVERIAEETGAVVGGKLYSGSLSGPDGPAPSYIELMRYNIRTLTSALGS